jgi:hypothetical protein
MRARCPPILVCRLAAALLCAAATVGCNSSGSKPSYTTSKGSAFASATSATSAAARVEAMAAADTYMTIVAQATDELRKTTKRDEVVEWAQEQRIATAIASFTNASGPNSLVALLDMLVLTRLKRAALQEYWIPTLLHEEGEPVLRAFRRGEDQVWLSGAKVLSEPQLAELRRIIEQWQTDNPTQYYVSHIRFTDFANAMRITSSSPQVKLPGSVFGLLYVDPLAGLDPVAKELAEYRALSERLLYVVNRMPIVLSWTMELTGERLTGAPQIVRFVESTSRFTEATTRFTDSVARMPKDLASERTAAIEQLDAATGRQLKGAIDQLDAATTRQVKGALDQMFAGMTAQREGIVRDLAGQESRMRAVVADVRGVVDRADEAGRSLNTATAQTIGTTEQATRRTLTHAFVLALVLVVAIALTMLAYRIAVKRWVLEADAHN